MDKVRLVRNAIRTPDGTILESRHVHDFKRHIDSVDGKHYMVDGGLEYNRRSSNGECMCVYLEDGHEVVREAATWGSYGKNGGEPLKYILIKDMTEEHILNCLKNCYRMHPHYKVAFENELKWREVGGVK